MFCRSSGSVLTVKNYIRLQLGTLPGDSYPCHDVTDLWVQRLQLWDQLCLTLAVNSTALGDNPGYKTFSS